MPAWSIDIVPGKELGDPATFVAQNQSAAPVGTLYADAGDVVSWNNTTTRNHQISLLGAPVVTPGHQTSAWNIAGTVNYKCDLHPDETGTIVVSA